MRFMFPATNWRFFHTIQQCIYNWPHYHFSGPTIHGHFSTCRATFYSARITVHPGRLLFEGSSWPCIVWHSMHFEDGNRAYQTPKHDVYGWVKLWITQGGQTQHSYFIVYYYNILHCNICFHFAENAAFVSGRVWLKHQDRAWPMRMIAILGHPKSKENPPTTWRTAPNQTPILFQSDYFWISFIDKYWK